MNGCQKEQPDKNAGGRRKEGGWNYMNLFWTKRERERE